jgi:hypothetical protein
VNRWLAAFALASLGCAQDSSTAMDLAVSPDLAPPIGMDGTVTLFDKTLFDSGHQNNDVHVTLPGGLFSQVILHVELACPTLCDQWDRIGQIFVVEPVGDDAGSERTIEVGRFITTFGVRGAWDIDVTELQPLLTGDRTLRGYIGTWVSQGSPYGNGWLLSAKLVYTGGVPSPEPIAVTPLPWRDFPIGDPSQPAAASLPPQAVMLAPGATGALVRVTVTGHGQGNKDNCGEFCSQNHQLLVDGTAAASTDVWRDDCDQNPISNQHGTWMYARAGWCPGEDVKPWRADLGPRPPAFSLSYATDAYVNTCSPTNCVPADCALRTACAYDGGNHTPPFYAFSALVISYR